jgi:hypothetical protein
MRKQTSSIFVAGMMLLVVICIVACHSNKKSSEAKADEMRSAQVATAQRGNLAHTFSLAGQFQPYQVVDVHPKVPGFMVKINVGIGDKVHQGQTLAVLEVPELKAQLRGTGFEIQEAKDPHAQVLTEWRVHMGAACMGAAGLVVILYLLELLGRQSKIIAWRSNWPWLPLVGFTAMATVIHIPAYAAVSACEIYSVWAFRGTYSLRRSFRSCAEERAR